MLRIDRNNYASLLDDRPDYLGMLQRAKDYITWGEPTVDTIKLILEKRAEIPGGKKLDEESIKKIGFENIESLAKSLYKCEIELNKIKGLKPFFRLHPPKKGFKRSVKRPYNSKGELGYRGETINNLAKRMC
jgi:large subunit ribosomal protein L30